MLYLNASFCDMKFLQGLLDTINYVFGNSQRAVNIENKTYIIQIYIYIYGAMTLLISNDVK